MSKHKVNQSGDIERLLLQIPGVVNFNKKHFFEVKPGRVSPIFINIKNTLQDFETRSEIVRDLSRLISLDTNCICGIESGGTYYASVVADALMKPLVLFRNQEKEYAEGGRFVGTLPSKKNGLISIVDDVIVSGKTIASAINLLRKKSLQVEIYAVFSYGLDSLLRKNLKTSVDAVANINALCEVAKELNHFTEKDIALIEKFVEKIKKGISK